MRRHVKMPIDQAVLLVMAHVIGDDSLRRRCYRERLHPFAGHCYVVAECLYHLLGGKERWTPACVRHEGDNHWYLRNKVTGHVLDPTRRQFKTTPPYHLGRGRGFLTRSPSRRAQFVLDKIHDVP